MCFLVLILGVWCLSVCVVCFDVHAFTNPARLCANCQLNVSYANVPTRVTPNESAFCTVGVLVKFQQTCCNQSSVEFFEELQGQHTHSHTHTHKHTHAHTHRYTHTQGTHAHVHTYTHTRTVHTQTKHTFTYTNTHIQLVRDAHRLKPHSALKVAVIKTSIP